MAESQWNRGLSSSVGGVTIALIACGLGCWGVAIGGAPANRHSATSSQWTIVSVELPVSDEGFPPGKGVEAATSYCLICHSAGMVLRQPTLTREDWRAEIIKMRSAYGAPVPDDQVDGLADYLVDMVE